MENLASKGPPMKNLVCNEKFGINCASAEAQFGTGRGIRIKNPSLRDNKQGSVKNSKSKERTQESHQKVYFHTVACIFNHDKLYTCSTSKLGKMGSGWRSSVIVDCVIQI